MSENNWETKQKQLLDMSNLNEFYLPIDKPVNFPARHVPKLTAKESAMADKWLKEMQELGMSYDEMLVVLEIARRKYLDLYGR